MKVDENWMKLMKIAWNCMKLREGEIFMPFTLQGNGGAIIMNDAIFTWAKSWAKLGKVAGNWLKLGQIGRRKFMQLFWLLQFQAIWCNFG